MTGSDPYSKIYEELIGFVPPKIQHRIRLGLETDPELLEVIENVREKAMYPDCFDVKTAQLILFAVLISHVSPASEFHARGAVRAGATKEELIGFVPPKIQHRIRLGLETDPELLEVIENVREKAMYPDCFDVKTAQLILFAVLISHVSPASEFHARGAVRAGATKEELHAVAGLAFLFRGLPAFNLAAEVINKIFDE